MKDFPQAFECKHLTRGTGLMTVTKMPAWTTGKKPASERLNILLSKQRMSELDDDGSGYRRFATPQGTIFSIRCKD